MRTILGARARVLLSTAAVGVALTVGLAAAAPASAHVHVDADDAVPGGTAVLTFRVPGESETGAVTTQLSVALPNVTSARTEVAAGWTARLDRDTAAGTVHGVTWTAAPGTGISSDQFALFRISVTLPKENTVSFPATQTYSDGQVVHWDQQSPPDGAEHPAPVLTMSSEQPGAVHEHGDDDHGAAPQTPPGTVDNSARWLAGAALLVAAAAVGVSVVSRRRS